jgi:NTE family protein
MKNKKGLVISGGGAKGAFAGGLSEYLVNNLKNDYTIFVGTSTGNLLIPFIALGEFEMLKEAYTSVTQDDIFTLNPFKVKLNNNGIIKTGINYWNVFKNIIINKQKTFGDSSALRAFIKKFFDNDLYKRLLLTDKEVSSCVVNVTLGQKEFKCNKNYDWSDFTDWMYVSCCAPPFMSLVEVDGYEYTDGGVMENVPIQEAINMGATEIDVICLRPEGGSYKIEKIRNVFHWLIKIGQLHKEEITNGDINLSKLNLIEEDVILNIYYTPRELTNNSLIFDKGIMSNWWIEGHAYGLDGSCISYLLKKGRKPKKI